MNTNTPSPQTGGVPRRGFLKTASTAAAGVALGSLDLTRSAHAAGSDVIRVGMIGCGGRNTGAGAQALQADPGARLVAMCDIFMDRVKRARDSIKDELAKSQKADQVQVPDDHCLVGFDSYKQVIDASDVVLIANAAKFHPFHLRAAIQAGKHVFVEKPHGIDPYGIRMVKAACDLAKQKKLSVQSGLHSRHHPGYIETIQRIHDGALGDVVAIEENFLRAPYGVIGRDPKLTELEYQVSTQYHFNWLSGDDVVQSLVHNLDRASWVLHDAVPVKCHGVGGRSTMVEEIYGNVFDHHGVTYEFPDGVRLYAFCRTTTGCYDESSSIILGSKGKASILNARIWGQNPWRWQAAGADPHQLDPYQIEHDKLFAAIRSGTPINAGDYMVRSTTIGIMGQISCYTGSEITWDQFNASEFFYPPKPEDCHDGMASPVAKGPDGSYPVYKPGQTKLL
ncbi:putative dehydrogenase [Verrucomicrobia bacterium]|nr:putative dehydrogenase [Verrucomicrobiota bacterium]